MVGLPVAPIGEAGQNDGLDNFVERRKENLRKVSLALEKLFNRRVTARAHAISRPSAGGTVERGSLVWSMCANNDAG